MLGNLFVKIMKGCIYGYINYKLCRKMFVNLGIYVCWYMVYVCWRFFSVDFVMIVGGFWEGLRLGDEVRERFVLEDWILNCKEGWRINDVNGRVYNF